MIQDPATPAQGTPIGANSRLQLVYTYQFADWGRLAWGGASRSERRTAWVTQVVTAGWFQPARIPVAEVLPHLNEHIVGKSPGQAVDPQSNDALLSLFTASDRLGNFTSAESTLHVAESAKKAGARKGLTVRVLGSPELYLFESGFVAICLEVAPIEATGEAFNDVQLALVRRGNDWVAASVGDADHGWTELLLKLGHQEPTSLRTLLRGLVPGLVAEPPRGVRPNPYAMGTLYGPATPSNLLVHRVRLFHGSKQRVSAPSSPLASPHALEASAEETWLLSPYGAVLYVHDPSSTDAFRADMHTRVRQSYTFMWLLVLHLRAELLDLSTQCARFEPSNTAFAETALLLQARMLEVAARHNFSLLSDETRHQQFYVAARGLAHVDTLLHEVLDEVGRIREHLAIRHEMAAEAAERERALRAEEEGLRAVRLNKLLALLTLVFTPAGLAIGVFQGETLPPALRPFFGGQPGVWGILTHGPLWVTLVAMLIGYLAYRRR